VTLTGTPDEGSALVSWEGCDEITLDMKCLVEMHTGRIVSAVFELDTRSALPEWRFTATTGRQHTRAGLPWLFAGLAFVAVVGVRSGRDAPWMIFAIGLIIFTACAPEIKTDEVPEPLIILRSASLPRDATGSVEIFVENIIVGDGIASLQGRINYDPGLIHVHWLYAENDFVVKAIDIDNERGTLLFAIVKPSDGGINTGAIVSIFVQAVGSPNEKAWFHWEDNEEIPSVVGGANNQELIGIGLVDGWVEIRLFNNQESFG